MEKKISQLPWSVDGCQIHSNGKYLLAIESGAPLSENKANAIAICEAMNSTYGKGIDPSSVPDLLDALEKIVAIATDRWRPLPATSHEKNCLSSARAAIKLAKSLQ